LHCCPLLSLFLCEDDFFCQNRRYFFDHLL
jgi:hypothetical protein